MISGLQKVTIDKSLVTLTFQVFVLYVAKFSGVKHLAQPNFWLGLCLGLGLILCIVVFCFIHLFFFVLV